MYCMLTWGLVKWILGSKKNLNYHAEFHKASFYNLYLFPYPHINTEEFYLILADNDNLQFNSNTEKNKVKGSTIFNIDSDNKLALYSVFQICVIIYV